jgi:hypothetical protein
MNYYPQSEKITICTDISTNLKFYKNKDNVSVNLFNDCYSFVSELKKIFNEYIKNDVDLKGTSVEIGKKIEFK